MTAPASIESSEEAWITRLQADDAAVRRVAVLEFADDGEARFLPQMIEILRGDSDRALRAEAARVLAGWEEPEVIGALTAALIDEAEVRAAAAESLAELKQSSSAGMLLRCLPHPDPFASASILRALKELRSPAAASPALAALTHSDSGVRREAVGVLGWLRHAEALPKLAELVTRDGSCEVRRAASGALAFAGSQSEASVVAALSSALLDSDWTVREEAAGTLGRFIAQGAEASEALRGALHDEFWQVRLRAARSLGRLRDSKAVPLLIEALLHPAGNLRREAAIALGEIGDRSATQALHASTADPDPEVRKAARLALQGL